MKLVWSAYLIVACILNGCSGINFSQWRFPYMYPVNQGNYINQQQLALLHKGMTMDQVSYIIGNPVSQFMFNSHKWQYIYQQYTNNKLTDSYIVNLSFNQDNLLSSVESFGKVFIR